jgi:hypothetical protein
MSARAGFVLRSLKSPGTPDLGAAKGRRPRRARDEDADHRPSAFQRRRRRNAKFIHHSNGRYSTTFLLGIGIGLQVKSLLFSGGWLGG